MSAQPKPRAAVIEAMLQYVHTDAACCRHEPGELADRQAQARQLLKRLRWFLICSCAIVRSQRNTVSATTQLSCSPFASHHTTYCFACLLLRPRGLQYANPKHALTSNV